MAARPVPTIEQVARAIDLAHAGRGRALVRLLRQIPAKDLESGIARHGVSLRQVLVHATGRMQMRGEIQAMNRRYWRENADLARSLKFLDGILAAAARNVAATAKIADEITGQGP